MRRFIILATLVLLVLGLSGFTGGYSACQVWSLSTWGCAIFHPAFRRTAASPVDWE
jgi:hypothetical protein